MRFLSSYWKSRKTDRNDSAIKKGGLVKCTKSIMDVHAGQAMSRHQRKCIFFNILKKLVFFFLIQEY